MKTTQKNDGPNLKFKAERLDLDGQINQKIHEIFSNV